MEMRCLLARLRTSPLSVSSKRSLAQPAEAAVKAAGIVSSEIVPMSHLGIGGRRVPATLLLVLLVLLMTMPSMSAVSVGRSDVAEEEVAPPLPALPALPLPVPLAAGVYVESHLTLIMAEGAEEMPWRLLCGHDVRSWGRGSSSGYRSIRC